MNPSSDSPDLIITTVCDAVEVVTGLPFSFLGLVLFFSFLSSWTFSKLLVLCEIWWLCKFLLGNVVVFLHRKMCVCSVRFKSKYFN